MFYEIVLQPLDSDEVFLFWGDREACDAYEVNELSENNPNNHPYVTREVTHDL